MGWRREGRIGLGLFGNFRCWPQRAQELKVPEGLGVGSGQGGFVAKEEGETFGVVGQAHEGVGEALVAVPIGKVVVGLFGAVSQFVGEHLRFDGEDAAETPLRGGHGGDAFVLEIAGGVEVVDVGGEQFVKTVARFGGEDDVLRAEAVAEGIASDGGFPLGSDGAAGLGSVGLGCRGFLFAGLHRVLGGTVTSAAGEAGGRETGRDRAACI